MKLERRIALSDIKVDESKEKVLTHCKSYYSPNDYE